MVRAMWAVVALFVVIGVGAAALRTIYRADLVSRIEPGREFLLQLAGIVDRQAATRAFEVARFDSPYGTHPTITLLHVIPGAIFFILAPIQFVETVRRRFITFHRWSGRLLLLVALFIASSALFFGELTPFGGTGEAIAVALFAILFLLALALAWLAIRRGQVARHRDWMIRAFAIAFAIATARVVGAVLELPLTAIGLRPAPMFVIAIWTGWLMSIGAAELWIHRTRAAVYTGGRTT